MKDVLRSIRRAPYQSLASMVILLFTLFLTLFFFTITTFFHGTLSYVETRPLVMAYFNTKTDEKKILEIKNQLDNSGKTSNVTYVSQKEAYEFYKQTESQNENPLLLAMVSPDILPASLEIRAKDPKYLEEIAANLKKAPDIDSIDFKKDDVNDLLTITSVLRKVSVIIFSILVFISVIVLMTTTAFKISQKKDEIELLQLLGASRWYIRKPFILEGILFGATSGAVSFLLLMVIFLYAKPFLNPNFLKLTNVEFYNMGRLGLYVWPPSAAYLLMTFLSITGFGVIIGCVGNYLAASKYIK